jgi:hypothetical protein
VLAVLVLLRLKTLQALTTSFQSKNVEIPSLSVEERLKSGERSRRVKWAEVEAGTEMKDIIIPGVHRDIGVEVAVSVMSGVMGATAVEEVGMMIMGVVVVGKVGACVAEVGAATGRTLPGEIMTMSIIRILEAEAEEDEAVYQEGAVEVAHPFATITNVIGEITIHLKTRTTARLSSPFHQTRLLLLDTTHRRPQVTNTPWPHINNLHLIMLRSMVPLIKILLLRLRRLRRLPP